MALTLLVFIIVPDNNNPDSYLQIALGAVRRVHVLRLRGRNQCEQLVTSYKVHYWDETSNEWKVMIDKYNNDVRK